MIPMARSFNTNRTARTLARFGIAAVVAGGLLGFSSGTASAAPWDPDFDLEIQVPCEVTDTCPAPPWELPDVIVINPIDPCLINPECIAPAPAPEPAPAPAPAPALAPVAPKPAVTTTAPAAVVTTPDTTIATSVPATTVANEREVADASKRSASLDTEDQASNSQSMALIALLAATAIAALFGVVLAAKRIIKRS